MGPVGAGTVLAYLANRLAAVGQALFFFQAEDGIRDYKVTGVQTCALPISSTRIFLSPVEGDKTAMAASSNDSESPVATVYNTALPPGSAHGYLYRRSPFAK